MNARGRLAACTVAWWLLLTGSTHSGQSCEIGVRPAYFVPGDGPTALLGCARLPVSGQRVEFSANLARLDGAEHLCVNPAYGGGAFIPEICKLDPPVSQFAVRDAMQPRQGVEGYGYVIWGTAGGARSVRVRFDGGIVDAALLVVPDGVAREYGECSFTLFVAELPLSAACGAVTVEAGGAAPARLSTVRGCSSRSSVTHMRTARRWMRSSAPRRRPAYRSCGRSGTWSGAAPIPNASSR